MPQDFPATPTHPQPRMDGTADPPAQPVDPVGAATLATPRPESGPVGAAYDALIAALRHLIATDDAACDRATAFRRHELELAARWRDGRMPHGSGPRAKKGAVA